MNALIFETMNNVAKPQAMTVERGADGLMHLEGVFGVCGVRNRNQRVYEYNNYKKCIDALNLIIERDGGVPGELEHPTDLNTHLENVSHKVERVSIDENGVITGRIALLNTEKGKNAQAMVEGGLPLFISSRGFGDEDCNGQVTLEGIITYDLVGTPGFEQARLTLTEAKKTLCESYDPTKTYGSNICVVPLNESALPTTVKVCDELDIKAMIDNAIAASLSKSKAEPTADVVTVELMEAYINDVVKAYIDECVNGLAEEFDNGFDEINSRLDKMKEKILNFQPKVPNVTRHRVYLHNQ